MSLRPARLWLRLRELTVARLVRSGSAWSAWARSMTDDSGPGLPRLQATLDNKSARAS